MHSGIQWSVYDHEQDTKPVNMDVPIYTFQQQKAAFKARFPS